MNIEALKQKTRAHVELANSMEEHSKEIENLVEEIRALQL